MHRLLSQKLAIPLLFRRTWPAVRTAMEVLHDAESRSAHATRDLAEHRALDAARWAAVHSPHYRAAFRGAGALDTIEGFRSLPVTTKADVRDHVEEIVIDGADRSRLQRSATGGSTGVPTPYYYDDERWIRASAAALRADEWTGWRVGDRHAVLWGTPLSESFRARCTRVAGEVARNQLFLPGFDLSDRSVDRNLDRLARWRPVLVAGYASVLHAHARRIVERGMELPAPRSVISAAETLLPEVRATVSRAFRSAVYDRYGCREIGILAQECSVHDGLHVVTEHVHLEIDVDGRPARPGETGRVLVTRLGRPVFPFVRYETGDLATAGDPEPCLCGLPFPRIARVDGRFLDVLRRADGGALSGTFFPHLMKEFPFVREFQVFQDETGAVDIRIVPGAGGTHGAAVEPVVRAARNVLGDLPVRVTFVEALERTPSGKVPVTRGLWKGPVAAASRAGSAT